VTDPAPPPDDPGPPLDEPAPAPAGFTYTVGIFEDLRTNSFWSYYGPDGDIWGQYVLAPTKPALFDITYPVIGITPDVAIGLPVQPVAEDDGTFSVTQPLRPDYTWSDGTPLTAEDVVFTFTTARDASLGGNWLTAYPYSEKSNPRLLDVVAVSPHEVKYVFERMPGLPVWPNNVGIGPIMPKHAWDSAVAEVLQEDKPWEGLYGFDPSGDVSGAESVFEEHEPGAFAVSVANSRYYWKGTRVTEWKNGAIRIGDDEYYGPGSGDVIADFVYGPFQSETIFSIYGDQTSALLALREGEVDYLLNPLGMQRGLVAEALAAGNLAVTVNPPNGFRYLAFNMRKSPGSYAGYRRAIAFMIDKEFLTVSVLQAIAIPVYTLVPEANTKWYDEEIADELSEPYTGLNEQERLNNAVAALQADGFTWEEGPEVDADGNIIDGSLKGLIDPTGAAVLEQEVLAPPASYDPLRATASLWIEGWMEKLGIRAKANPTGFGVIVSEVWPGVGVEPTFDTYILGWSLGNPSVPSFQESFFHSRNLAEANDGGNSTGYSDPEFDAMADALLLATTEAEAYDLIWNMERKIATDLPYIVLFNTPIIEFYNKDVQFPFVDTLSGIQFLQGLQNAVRM
jgi:ABC-type transport system substrate-binding protein